MSKPLVSVGVPCYNYGRYLDFCLKSLFNQTYRKIQIIVVDDHSIDNTPQVVRKYGDKIEYVRHRVNQGNVATYNHTIELAKGKYFTLLSADDGLLPTCIERSVAILKKYPKVGLVYTAVKIINEKNEVTRVYEPRQKESYIGDNADFNMLLTNWDFVPAPGALMRTKIFAEVGGYDSHFPVVNDWDMWLKISQRYQLAYFGSSEPQAFYRVHRASSHIEMEKTGRAISDVLRLYDKWFNDSKVPLEIRQLRREVLFNCHLAFVGKYSYNKKYARAFLELIRGFAGKPESILGPRLYLSLLGTLREKGRDLLKNYLPHHRGG